MSYLLNTVDTRLGLARYYGVVNEEYIKFGGNVDNNIMIVIF
jgi:hypothetical protein